MMILLLVAGISVIVAGLAAIGFGIPVKEFSFGNTLILIGAIAVCTGLIMLSLALVVRELRAIARRLGPADPTTAVLARPDAARDSTVDRPLFDPAPPVPEDVDETDGEVPAAPTAAAPIPPWQEEATRARQRGNIPPAPAAAEPAAPEAKPRRNLLFSSSSRRERERAAARTPDAPTPDPGAAAATPPEAAPRTFEDAWPAIESMRSDSYRRPARTPSPFNDTPAPAPAPPTAVDASQVTVLKSGVVDGMAYSLYSDGSIEAQMPEGMMRFASIGELRAHLDQRP